MWPFRFTMHRKRGLRNMVIYLLSSSPKNGVELMDGVEALTKGWWRPTAGSIYPLLKDMVDQGLLEKREQDGRYLLTSKMKSQVDISLPRRVRRPRTTAEMVGAMHSYVSYMEDLKGTRRDDLKPHANELRALAKRLSDLAGKEEGGGADS
jgi:DNA-binding PadR family transcriptional regulator